MKLRKITLLSALVLGLCASQPTYSMNLKRWLTFGAVTIGAVVIGYQIYESLSAQKIEDHKEADIEQGQEMKEVYGSTILEPLNSKKIRTTDDYITDENTIEIKLYDYNKNGHKKRIKIKK